MTKKLLFIASLAIVLSSGVFGVCIASAASLNNFTIENFQTDFYLSRDEEGRSTLKTVERIVANFPSTDQNHGLERALPQKYDNHPTKLKVLSVENESGDDLPYETTTKNDNLIIRIGDEDTYVHGLNTYVITYSQRDTTKYFESTGKDEFYWDANGTEWSVPIKNLTARIHITPDLQSRSTEKIACYQGRAGSTTACPVVSGAGVYTASATNLAPSENITLALGFMANTFSAYQQTAFEKLIAKLIVVWSIVAIVTSLIGIALIIWLVIRARRINDRPAELEPIVSEYLPPKDVSVMAASKLLPLQSQTLTAQLIDFAVRHYIKIYQTADKTTWKPAEYELELVKDPVTLKSEERKLLELLFSDDTKLSVGSRFKMKDLIKDYKLGKSIDDVITGVAIDQESGYTFRTKDFKESKIFKHIGWWTLGFSLLTLSPVLFVASITAFIFGATLAPLTDTGLHLRRYLQGLKHYIKVAEKERLKMLQSPDGAQKIGGQLNSSESSQLVHLYEKVLPYAILFGQEKQWNKQLGAHFESAGYQPDWYSGPGLFNAAVFSSAISNFSSATAYATSQSSSTGGSGGGGSSGGGGGGGGGGGW